MVSFALNKILTNGPHFLLIFFLKIVFNSSLIEQNKPNICKRYFLATNIQKKNVRSLKFS